MAPERNAIRYRIPVVDGHAVYLCIRCGQVIDLVIKSRRTKIYESPDGVCSTCKGILKQEMREDS